MRARRGADYLFIVAGGVVVLAGALCLLFPEINYHAGVRAPVLPGLPPEAEHRSLTVPATYAAGLVIIGLWCLFRAFKISMRGR